MNTRFWAVLALIQFRLTLGTRAPTSRRARPIPRLTALTHDETHSRDASEVRRAYTTALAERVGLMPESFTRPGALARALRRRGVTTAVALDAENFLRQLDEAAFSASGSLPANAAERGAELYRLIDGEALARMHMGVPMLSIIGALAIGVATAHAFEVDTARRAFDTGVAAYEHHNFVAAREAFIASVVAAPRAPDARANLGTASWAVRTRAHRGGGRYASAARVRRA
jgi:hypothetical protein